MTRTPRTFIVAAIALVLTACTSNPKAQSMSTQLSPPRGVMRHVVLFRFKPGTTPEQIKTLEDAFAGLPQRIPSILGYEWGTNVSPESHDQGYTHCFLVTFADAAGRDAYLPHPAHGEFVRLLLPHLDQAHVIDYVAR